LLNTKGLIIFSLVFGLLSFPSFSQTVEDPFPDSEKIKNQAEKVEKQQQKASGKNSENNPGIKIRKWTPLDSSSVIQLPTIRFENLNSQGFFVDKGLLQQIYKFQRNEQYELALSSMNKYIGQFGIQNFLQSEEYEIIWAYARLAEYLEKYDYAKDAYRLILKHYRGDVQEALDSYNERSKYDKDLWVKIEDYYRLVERRRAIDTLKPPSDVLINMGDDINSYHEDYAPTLAADDRHLIFTSKRVEKKPGVIGSDIYGGAKANEDLYISIMDKDDYWSPPKKLNSLNTSYNEGSAHIAKDGKTLYFSRCHDPAGYGDCDIYYATKVNDTTWAEPSNLGPGVNSYAWDSHPALSVTGDTLYFSSARRGGFGGLDLYYVVKGKDGTFGRPLNLGPVINTKGNEVSPFVHPINNTLFFSSDAQLVNFGSFDIYKSYQREHIWTEPKNVGPLVNGEGDEFYFAIDSKARILYYARSEEEGDINLDLHSFPLPMEAQPNAIVRFSGRVIEESTGEVFKGIVSVIDLEENIEVAPKRLHDNGSFEFELIDHRNYLLIIEGDNFFNIREVFYMEGDREADIPVKGVLNTITFESIDFDPSSARLKPGMENNLHLIVDFLTKHPKYFLTVTGHTDGDGDYETNMALSFNRATAIKDFILAYGGFDEARVEAYGMGSTKPLKSPELTEADKKMNRRVEFKLFIP
jgi:flagellar motor protein MotB